MPEGEPVPRRGRSTGRGRRGGRWFARLALLGASLAVSVVFMEVTLRVLGFPTRVLEFEPSGVPGYNLMAPSQDFVERAWYKYQPPHRIRINSRGLRGNEVGADRRWTILVLGDSFTFGAGVNLEDTFGALLEQRLRRHFGSAVEVVNAGYGGATIDHELVVFERQGLPLRPDVVVLQFFANDIEDLLQRQERNRVYRQIDFPLKQSVRRTAIYVLLLKLKLSGMRMKVSRERPAPAAAAQPLPFREDDYYAAVPSVKWQKGWDLYFSYLERLVDRAREERIPLVILIVPDEYQVLHPKLFPAPQERLRAFARAHGLLVVDPLPTFRGAAAAGETIYLPGDGHLTPRGNAVIADVLLDGLMEHRLAYARLHSS